MSIIDKVEVDGTIYDIVGGGILPHLVISTDSGLTVTVTKGTTIITATETSESIYECDVTEFGTYTISDTLYTENVVIDAVKIYEIFMMPDGETVLPTDDIQTWLECAGIFDKTSYTTLADVLADSTTLLALMSDNNAVDYLVRSTTWVSGVTADSTAMTDIGANNYCANTLLDDATWCDAICNSTYFESVLTTKVPTMTSNTTPSGEAIKSSQLDASFAAYKVFDGVDDYNHSWYSSDAAGQYTPCWVGYDFGSPVKIYRVKFFQNYANADRANKCKYQASTDNSTWVDISPEINVGKTGAPFNTVIAPNMVMSGRYVRIYWVPNGHCGISEIQFYGREDV